MCDVRDWDATRQTVEELGDIHLLVNNAAVVELEDALDATPENFDWYVVLTEHEILILNFSGYSMHATLHQPS